MSSVQNDPYQAQSRKSTLALFIGGVVLALLGGFALGKGGAVGLLPTKGGDVSVVGGSVEPDLLAGGGRLADSTSLTGEAQQPDLQLGFDPTRPNLEIGSQAPPSSTQMADKMPYEVREWLKHLERCESERNRMTKAQLGKFIGQMMGMGGGSLSDLLDEDSVGTQENYDPQKKDQLKGDTEASRKGWKDLIAYFNSKQPPAECVPIKNAYEQCLGETSAMMMDILGELEKSQSDPQGAINNLLGMMGTSEGKIDVAANKSDSLVGEICHKYDTYKWFSVKGDIGGGLGSLGLGGLGGGLGGMDLGDLLGGG